MLRRVKPSRETLFQSLAVTGLAVAALLYYGGAYPNFDSAYAVVWGSELMDGALPDYNTGSAPTPHPLATAVGALAAVLGDQAYAALAVLSYLSFGVLVVAVFRLGRGSFSWRVGLLAAFVVASSYVVVARTTAAYFDLPAVALVVIAGALESERPRRGVAVLALLAVAGLQRPEAWLLAGLYWLYLLPALRPRQRVGLAALTAAAPLLWMLADLVVTGDPLFSFVGTKETLEEASIESASQGRHTPGVLDRTWDGLREILRWPVLVGVAPGVMLAAIAFRSRARVPAAATVLGVGSFVGLGLADFPLVDRFLFIPAAMLATFFALAAIGWLDGRATLTRAAGGRHWLGAAWVAGGIALLLGLAASLPTQLDRLRDLRHGTELRLDAVEDLDGLTELSHAGAALRSCPRVYVPNDQLIPLVAYAVGRSPRHIINASAHAVRTGAYVAPTSRILAGDAFYLAHEEARVEPGEAFEPREGNASWQVYTRGCGPGA